MLPWKRRRWPLFLRIFLLMLACIVAVQLMNLVLLLAAQTPSSRVTTVAQVVDAMRGQPHADSRLRLSEVAHATEGRWSPRGERLKLAVAMALAEPPERIRISFPLPFTQRPQVFDRTKVPRLRPPDSLSDARDVVVTGDFSIALRMSNGRWLQVDSDPALETWRWLGLAWLLMSGIAAALVAWVLARRLARPIGAFAAAAERLGRDPKAPPLEISASSAEIAEAAAAFNRMQDRLNRYVDNRTLVIGAVAHDLRTPLMRLGLRLEDVPAPVRDACESDIRDMQAMLSAAIAFVRETGEPVVRRPLDLRSLAETVTDEMSDRGAAVTIVPGPPVVIEGNPQGLKALVTNLVTNAVKYAGGAEVALTCAERQAVIEVRDRGPGMASDDLERAFEPFFRGERSRNRDTGGVGLGLASVRAVARAHGGEASLSSRAGGGLVARVVLPV